MKNIILVLLFLFSFPAFGREGGKVSARLIAEGGVTPGGSVTVALEEEIAQDWHTYWRNPGDAGSPTQIEWRLPPGWKADAIQWPVPKRLPVGPLMDYGYEGKVWLLTKITMPADAHGPIEIKAHASWLVCKNVCVPEEQTLSLTLNVGGGADASVARSFAAAHALLPAASPWKTTYALGNSLDLYIAVPSLAAAHPKSADFFPASAGLIKNAVPQLVGYAKAKGQEGLVLRLTPGSQVHGALNGVLVLTSTDGSTQALQIAAAPGPVPPATFEAFAATRGDLALWLAILSALLGGLILNVMPCVLPILAMKVLALAQRGEISQEKQSKRESFAYAGGAIVSFAALGLTIVLLRAGGAGVGWGFQLQSPIAVAGFALLVFAVGLNLSGVFEVGSITAGEGLTQKGGYAGAFFTGVLAVAVAAPCTAPFMAAALGFALSQPAINALAVFVALGVGFALPFLLLGIWPGALAFLPKPGAWMLTFKQLLAFPMYAAAVWLVWVLAQEAGPRGTVIILAAMTTAAFAAWLWTRTRDLSSKARGIGATIALGALAGALYGVSLLTTAAAPQQTQATKGEAYSAAKLAAYRAKGIPVFVDATAAWCITCLVNEDAVLSQAPVKQAFANKHVVYMVADWTSQNPGITALLKDNARSGVPMYAYYASGVANPKLLPQILTQKIVLDAL